MDWHWEGNKSLLEPQDKWWPNSLVYWCTIRSHWVSAVIINYTLWLDMAAFNHPSSEQATEVHLTYMICCSPAYDVRNNFIKIKFLRQITDISFVFHVLWPPKYIGISMVLSFCKFLPIRSNHRFIDILSARQNVSDAVIWSYWWYQLCSGRHPPLWSCPQLGCPHWGSPVGTCV